MSHCTKNAKNLGLVYSGAGTGIFTSNLINHTSANDKIKSIIAIEPSPGMREAFNKNEGLSQYLNGTNDGKASIEVRDGSFGEIPVPDGSVDLVVGKSSRFDLQSEGKKQHANKHSHLKIIHSLSLMISVSTSLLFRSSSF